MRTEDVLDDALQPCRAISPPAMPSWKLKRYVRQHSLQACALRQTARIGGKCGRSFRSLFLISLRAGKLRVTYRSVTAANWAMKRYREVPALFLAADSAFFRLALIEIHINFNFIVHFCAFKRSRSFAR